MAKTYLNSYEGYFGSGVQTAAIGTKVAATSFQAITNSTLKQNRPGKAAIPVVRQSRNFIIVPEGRISVSGGVTGPLMPDEYFHGQMWADLMGGQNAVSGDDENAYTHTFDEARNQTDADWSTYGRTNVIYFGGTDSTMLSHFVGCFLNTVQVSVPEDGAVELTAEYLGHSEETGGSEPTPTYYLGEPYQTHHVDLQIGADIDNTATVEFTSMNININNNIGLQHAANSQNPQGVNYGMLEATFDFTFPLKSSQTILDYFRNNTERAAKIIMTHDDQAGTTSGDYSLTFNFPRFTVLGDLPDLPNADSENIPVTISCQVLEDATEGYAVQVVAVNSESGTYSVN